MFFVFIFSLINILVDRQKKKQTSDKYTRFQKTVLLFQLSQNITISKVVLYILENYNQQIRSLHRSFSTEDHDRQHLVKEKTIRKRKRKGRRRRKEGMMEEARLKNIPSKSVSEYVPWSSSINEQD